MILSYDRKFMQRAIELALKGKGKVNPNPVVGAVIVKDGKVIGEGYHTAYGELHAEREAIKSAEEKGFSCQGAEMYVTLEPCCHAGKQPPCTDAIIDAGIKRVYVGSEDPNPLVSGNGIWKLREKGISVVTNSMKKECDRLNPIFFHYITTNRPYVMYKYAMTIDGKTATKEKKSMWISSEESRALVQEYRNEYMAIMVGIGTVLKDDPSLMCHKDGGRNPIRIICDSDLRIPFNSKIVQTSKEVKTYIASLSENEKRNRQKIRELKDYGIGTLLIPRGEDGKINLEKLMDQLGKMHIDSVLLEGGGTLAWSMMSSGYVDEINCFMGPKVFGGEAPTPVVGDGVAEVGDAFQYKLDEVRMVGPDALITYRK
ncbi:MAG: bifunctional diaminohydroxyphosphoribosylaminopyrimidine deaminase/5-amino-6-(5-phosphoribosylamino)uracil reductase RibD [Eubacterium sp.]|nr:bifunctional diaminohydroxyphosphoribosylaminopyrimidine deaminase/5-amino-6-(5-phosphoribosylamino)uracil reductase RibD [Eubacterium sp.]